MSSLQSATLPHERGAAMVRLRGRHTGRRLQLLASRTVGAAAIAAQPRSHVQVLVEPTAFLLFVSVSVFFPGLPRSLLSARGSCSQQATPGLVAHDSLDPFGQCSDVLLERGHTIHEQT